MSYMITPVLFRDVVVKINEFKYAI
jgi:hypothetical protein